ncbi:hypothetical protein EVAR_27338_1 [Eumeta japonica]|uniref:Uncharacterized protein n=1 Tax=Eumeta variegata TaxID=151549 RepID=A0A4C1UDW0_EUMVA|nr:hypothetical protein EVAR_27338_1 [Eumeta japonica]
MQTCAHVHTRNARVRTQTPTHPRTRIHAHNHEPKPTHDSLTLFTEIKLITIISHLHSLRKLRESKKIDLFYHLLRNVSLRFLNHAGAQHSELSAARRRGFKFKGADADLTFLR